MPAGSASAELQVYNPVLTNIARLYRPAGRLYDELLVSQKVDKITDQYITWDERDWFNNADDNKVAENSPLPEIEVHWSTDSFTCEDYGLKARITPRQIQQSRGVGGLDKLRERKVSALLDQMSNRREKRLAALLRKTTNGGQLNLGAAATTAFASSTVIEANWETAKLAIYNLTGKLPTHAVIPYGKAVDMALNTTLRDILKYFVNSTGFVALGKPNGVADGSVILPQEFHGTKIVVPYGALAQTGHEGAAKSLSDVWGTSVRFIYKPDGADAGDPATAYSFTHPVLSSDAIASAGAGPVVSTYRVVDPTAEFVCAEECMDEKVTAPDTGYELTGV